MAKTPLPFPPFVQRGPQGMSESGEIDPKTSPFAYLFSNLAWICPLVAAEQVFFEKHYGRGTLALALGFCFFWLSREWRPITEWVRRRLATAPTDDELGDWEHGERIDSIWKELTRRRVQMYEGLVKVHKVAR